ncbi:MAG TPA: hypothetical protein VN133_01315 [Humibacter sp.]|nr:hypothetical protein [Humibacter sp.]
MAESDDELASIASELYMTEPARFIRARTELAQDAKENDRRDLAAAIAALKKSSSAAWAVNLLARERPGDFDALAEVADDLHDLQRGTATGDPAAALDERRRRTMAAAIEHARDIAQQHGVHLSAAAVADVEATLRAVLTDDTAAAAARSGMLVRGLKVTGWQSVDVSDALAVGEPAGAASTRKRTRHARVASGGSKTSARGEADAVAEADAAADAAAERRRREARSAAERVVAHAEDEHAQAVAELTAAASEAAEAEAASEAAEAEAALLRAEFERAQTASDRTGRNRAAAERRRERAEEAVAAAEQAVADARARLQVLGRAAE